MSPVEVQRPTRRHFLGDLGLGFTGLALRGLLAQERRKPAATVSPAKADHVIWLFMMGGVSHVEGFDPKPALTRYGGLRIDATPHRKTLDDHRLMRQEFGQI